MKKLLMSVIGHLIADTGVQPVVIVIVKILGDALLGIGQVGEKGPLAKFEHLRFEAGPPTFDLRVIIAVAAAALRAHGLVVVQQFAVGIAAVLPAPVRVYEQAGSRRLGSKSPL